QPRGISLCKTSCSSCETRRLSRTAGYRVLNSPKTARLLAMSSKNPPMPELESRLINCFALAFPELSPQEIPAASTSSLESWDSVAAITLISVSEEEFGISVTPDDVADLSSYGLILDYLQRRQSDTCAQDSRS